MSIEELARIGYTAGVVEWIANNPGQPLLMPPFESLDPEAKQFYVTIATKIRDQIALDTGRG